MNADMRNAALADDPTVTMDAMYRYQRHIYDFTRKFYLLGRDNMIAGLDARSDARVLEIGCGTGRNLIQAARLYRDAHFVGVDVSHAMLAVAEGAIARAGYGKRVMVAHADATNFDPAKNFGVSKFDRVFISYCLSMIPAWEQALERAVGLLAPGGQLHIVDFGRQQRLPAWFRIALRWWLSQFQVLPRDDLEMHLRKLALRQALTLTMNYPCLGYAQHAVVAKRNP